MIDMYTGTGGSGKSYHMAKLCYETLKYTGRNVITTFTFKTELAELTKVGRLQYRLEQASKGKIKFGKKKGHPLRGKHYRTTLKALTVPYLVEFAREHHVPRKESQTIVMVDEAELKWNARHYSAKDRNEWLEFFPVSRHLGYDFIMVTQNDRMIDRQIRSLVEHEYAHRQVKQLMLAGKLLSKLFGGNLFLVHETWYVNKTFLGNSLLPYRKHIGLLYDTFEDFLYGFDWGFAGVGGAGELGGPSAPIPAKPEGEKLIAAKEYFGGGEQSVVTTGNEEMSGVSDSGGVDGVSDPVCEPAEYIGGGPCDYCCR